MPWPDGRYIQASIFFSRWLLAPFLLGLLLCLFLLIYRFFGDLFVLGTVGARNDYSDKMAEAIDDEIRRLVDAASARAQAIIAEHRDVVVRLARALVEKESLDITDLERIFRGELESRPELMRLPSHSQESAA